MRLQVSCRSHAGAEEIYQRKASEQRAGRKAEEAGFNGTLIKKENIVVVIEQVLNKVDHVYAERQTVGTCAVDHYYCRNGIIRLKEPT